MTVGIRVASSGSTGSCMVVEATGEKVRAGALMDAMQKMLGPSAKELKTQKLI